MKLPRAFPCLAIVGAVTFLSACSKPHSEDAAATQVAAKVNGAEITVFRLNAALAQTPNIPGNSTQNVAGEVLERLIDQELLVQKGHQGDIDHNPQVVQAIEAARRSIIANAYLQQITASIAKPSDQDIQQYYVQHPEYFAARRFYVYRSLVVSATPAQVQAIQQQLAGAKELDFVANYLGANRLSFVNNKFARSTEQLSASAQARFSALKEGETTTLPSPGGVELVQLISSSSEPVDEARARPSIENYLIEQRRKDRAAQELKYLRSGATIQYLGNFKAPAVPEPTSNANSVADGGAAGIK